MTQMSLSTKNRLTDRKQTYGYQRGKVGMDKLEVWDKHIHTTIRQWHPLQYSCLENPMGGGAWWAAVHGVA